jgi:DNA-binding winged helix-turn-helix (wHTH) protein/tetratricopeptide (TPR) repeat protein
LRGVNHLLEFGPFRVDPVRGVLLRDNEPVTLTPKALETLLVLIRRREETVSKDELLQAVWPDTFVEESNLTQHISMLRRALGESPQDRRYVATVPGVGYRFVAPVREVAETLAPESDLAAKFPSSQPADSQPTSVSRKRFWIAAAGIAGVVIFVAAGSIWMSRVKATRALSDKDSILLADFKNSTGDPVFDGALKQGMAVQLGQSPFLDVTSADRVRETLGFMGRSPDEPVVLPLAREVCVRLGAKALIAGSITRLGTSYVLAMQALNCQDSHVLAQEQVEVRNKEDVLPALGKSAARLRGNLGESLNSIQRFDVPIEQATTPSLDALKAYSLGVEQRTRGNEREAIPFFEHAIELDPSFAAAHAQLGVAYRNLGETDRAADYLKKAFGLSSHLSERERQYITVQYDTLVLGDTDKATETYEIWSRMYPRDWIPFNGLAARYQVSGEYEKAAAAAREAMRLQPNHYSPYANLASSYLELGKVEEAKQICAKAAEAGRDSWYTHRTLFEIAFMQHDTAAMQREMSWAAGADRENDMLTVEALVLASEGKLHAARQLYERSWSASLQHGLKDDAAYSMAGEALTEADFGNSRQAIDRANTAVRLGDGIDARETAAEALAVAGDSRQSQALADDLKHRFPAHKLLNLAALPSAAATIELRANNPAKAVQTLEQAAPYDLCEFASLSPIYVRGQAYLGLHDGKEAAAEFQRILDHSGIDPTSQRHPLARLGLARAYALSADLDDSRKAYEEFISEWSGADPDLPILQQAKAEYARLKK